VPRIIGDLVSVMMKDRESPRILRKLLSGLRKLQTKATYQAKCG